MKLVDVPEVTRIEKHSFSAPWPSSLFIREILAASTFPLVARVIEEGQTIVAGFLMSRITSDHLHITNVAVDPEYRRLGFAKRLIDETFQLARSQGCTTASLEVRISNKHALRLYRKLKFRTAGRIPGYYEDNNEDAFLLVKDLT